MKVTVIKGPNFEQCQKDAYLYIREMLERRIREEAEKKQHGLH